MASMIEAFHETLIGAQTEIALFTIALCAHALLFGRYRVVGPVKAKELLGPSHPPRTNIDLGLRSLLRQRAGREALVAELEASVLAGQKNLGSALADMLESVGKGATGNLVAAVREILHTNREPLNARLAELLLRSCFSMSLLKEFNEVFSMAREANLIKPSMVVLAVRTALASSDLEGALFLLRSFAAVLKESSGASPSMAMQCLVQPLVELAVQKAKLPALLQELHDSGLLVGSAVEAALAAAVQGRHSAALRQAEKFVRSTGQQLTETAFVWLLRGAGEAGAAIRLLKEAKGKGLVGGELLLAALESATAYGDLSLANVVVEQFPAKPSPELAMAMLRLYGKVPSVAHDPDTAVLDLFERSLSGVDVLTDASAGRLVGEAALRSHRPELLVRLLAATPVGPRHVALLKHFGSSNRLPLAFEVFNACSEQTACLYNALLDACIDCRDMDAAEKVMSEAVSANMVDVVTYNTLIKKLLQCGDLPRARAVIETMRTAGGNLAPNAVTFNEFIDAVVRSNPAGAWELIDEMSTSGLQPNGVTCSILLKGVQKTSPSADVERTMAFVGGMEDVMDEVLLSSVCEACIRAGRPDLLQKPLRRQRGARAVPVAGAHTYGSLIRAYGFVKDLDGAHQTWREMRARRVTPTNITIGCMVEALSSNGDPEAGYRLIHELLEDEQTRPLVNSVMYGSVLKGFSQQKRFDRVWALYEEMAVKELQLSPVTYNALINTCVRSGEMARIPKLLADMEREKIEPNLVTYSTVLKAYCQENRLDKAFEMLEGMKQSGQFKPDEITYNTLIDGCARNCLYERGVAVLEEMQTQGVRPSAYTLSLLAKLANRCNKPEKAFELCDEISRKYRIQRNVHVFNNLIGACTTHGDLQRGLGLLEQMLRDKVRPDVRSYSLLLRSCLNTGALQDAVGLVRAATGLRGAHPRVSPSVAALAQPRDGLPPELLTEVLEGVARHCGEEVVAVHLLRDLRRVPGVKLDPKLPLSLTSKAIKGF